MSRPRLFDRPLTGAERVARSRQREAERIAKLEAALVAAEHGIVDPAVLDATVQKKIAALERDKAKLEAEVQRLRASLAAEKRARVEAERRAQRTYLCDTRDKWNTLMWGVARNATPEKQNAASALITDNRNLLRPAEWPKTVPPEKPYDPDGWRAAATATWGKRNAAAKERAAKAEAEPPPATG
jgi:hypothetical protein